MKKILLLLCAIAGAAAVHAQNIFPTSGAAGIGTTAPGASSLLEIKSTTKGLLIPRMTIKQRNAITSPATGLLIYQTDGAAGFYYYSGTLWTAVSSGGGAETDPQVGANTTDKIPRWDGNALSSGAISDNGDYIAVGLGIDSKYRINSRTSRLNEIETVGKSAMRGESNSWSGILNNIYATGYLGVKNPSGIYSVIGTGFSNSELNHFGVFGVKEYDTIQGAGVYGWTRGGASVNYGTMGVSTSNTGNNYGLYGKATGDAGLNAGVWGKAEGANINYGLYGIANANGSQYGYGIYATTLGNGKNYAGYFGGHVQVNNTGEALTIGGTNAYIQVKNGSNNIGYLQGYNSDYILATNSENNGNLIFGTKALNRMYINSSGKISVNNSSITGQFNIKGTNEVLNINGTDPYIQFTGTANVGYVRAYGNSMLFAVNKDNASGNLQFRTKDKIRMMIGSDGNVAIGEDAKFANGYLLSIQGKVIAEEMLVQLSGGWPDYVFEKEYKLMKLSELKNYIEQNNHLPDVPAARDMQSGIAVGNMNKILVQKVEELTLYILQLHEEIEQLKNKQ